jgi:hypothetical protein
MRGAAAFNHHAERQACVKGTGNQIVSRETTCTTLQHIHAKHFLTHFASRVCRPPIRNGSSQIIKFFASHIAAGA